MTAFIQTLGRLDPSAFYCGQPFCIYRSMPGEITCEHAGADSYNLKLKMIQAWVLENRPRPGDTIRQICDRYERWALRHVILARRADMPGFCRPHPDVMRNVLTAIGIRLAPPPSPSEPAQTSGDVLGDSLDALMELDLTYMTS